jgi:hypothetical protein
MFCNGQCIKDDIRDISRSFMDPRHSSLKRQHDVYFSREMYQTADRALIKQQTRTTKKLKKDLK